MPSDLDTANPDFQTLRFAAMLKAARDFGLDQKVANAISLVYDPRRPDLAQAAEALAEALLARGAFEVPDTA